MEDKVTAILPCFHVIRLILILNYTKINKIYKEIGVYIFFKESNDNLLMRK